MARGVPASSPNAREPRRTGAQLVYEALRRDIMSLDLAPGAALDEGQLCRHFKVSRTPVREALIRLASEGLAELNPNRGAKVASIEFVDVVDHYEAMDVFMPVACHFAAVRHTAADLASMQDLLTRFERAVGGKDSSGMVRSNYELHSAIARACHNRCIERGYRQMLADKLRLMQHGLPGTTYDKGHALADRFTGTAAISGQLVRAIGKRDAAMAEKLARRLNDFVRSQVIGVLSGSLGKRLDIPLQGIRERAELRSERRPDKSAQAQRTKKRRNPRVAPGIHRLEEGGGD